MQVKVNDVFEYDDCNYECRAALLTRSSYIGEGTTVRTPGQA
jgi:hypothetical protein